MLRLLGADLKVSLLSDEDGFRAVLQGALQVVLEAEMSEARDLLTTC